MSDITTVTLELLRHGPRHNQLLSPLTQYIAVCGRHDPETLNLPYEHQQMMLKLRALRYEDSITTREMQLDETMRGMGEILDRIRSLVAELARAADSKCRLVHLRFVYSAAELALLPFELAIAPNGYPGAGQPLLLQSEIPICLTREARCANTDSVHWGRTPHIVFAYASPAGVHSVPYKTHLCALRKAIDPWISQYPDRDTLKEDITGPDDPGLKEHRRECVKKYLTVLPDASLEDIQDACAQQNPAFVHILAHGIQTERAGNRRFGLALHHHVHRAKMDVVDERRLSEALRPHLSACKKGLSSPLVVTIASCDSGGQGDVTGVGASLAHAIHEKGIPLVIASQFPLTIAGANRLVSTVYEKLLWGHDPRIVLSELRRGMKILSAENHDWASLVAYASFPPDLETKLKEITTKSAKESIETALNDADNISQQPELRHDIQKFIIRIEKAKSHIERLSEDDIRIQGLLATANKREAQILHKVSEQDAYGDILTEKALHHYERAFLLDKGASWSIVQMLALIAYLQKRLQKPLGLPIEQWIMAKECAELELRSGDPQTVAWGLGSLCELFILAPLVKDGELIDASAVRSANAMETAVAYAARMARECAGRWRELYSTRRQIERYVSWFKIDAVTPLAEAVLKVLPDVISWK